MALTLTEGNKYSRTELAGYVIDLLSKQSQVLENLPFIEILGNSWTYDMVTTRSGAKFYSVGQTWEEDTLVLTQDTAALTILGGDADVDNFLRATRSNILDLRGEVIMDKVRAVKEKYLDTFYYGSGTAPEFKGLQKLLTSTSYNTVHAGSSTGSVLKMDKLQQAIDLIHGYDPAHIIMSKEIRRYINIYLNSIGDKFTAVRNEFGKMIEYYRGIPIIIDEHILNTETASSGAYLAKTGGGNTTIYVAAWDAKAICGIQGPNQVETIPLGDLETKDAQRYRIRWYCGMKFEDLRSAAKVDGVDSNGTVVA